MSLFSWFEAPSHVKTMLYRAVLSWEDRNASADYVMRALKESDDNLDVLTASYRFFFYRQDYHMALQLALKVMDVVRSRKKLPEKREELLPYLMERLHDYEIRLFINAYAAYAFILARLGNTEKAKDVLCFLKEVDQKGEFGVPVMLEIMERRDDDIL